MGKLFAFAFLALVLAGGVAVVSVEQSTPALACGSRCPCADKAQGRFWRNAARIYFCEKDTE